MEQLRGRLYLLVGALAAISLAVLTLGLGVRGADAQDGAAVAIVDFAFEPASLEVPVGTTVTWTNSGGAPHTVTADDGAFNSGQLAPGASFSQTFDAAGSFSYFCEIHPQMTGTIVVTEAAAAPAPAPAPAADETPTEPAQAADDAAAAGAAPVQLPATGVGMMALDGQAGGIALLAALAAVMLGLIATLAYRRA